MSNLRYLKRVKDFLTPNSHKLKSYIQENFKRSIYKNGVWMIIHGLRNPFKQVVQISLKSKELGHDQIKIRILKNLQFTLDLKDLQKLKSKIENAIAEYYIKEEEKLQEELPVQELQDILSDISDLTTIKHNIKIQTKGADLLFDRSEEDSKICYKVEFDLKSFNKSEYSEFIKIMDDVIGRLKSTYNVEINGRVTKLNINNVDDNVEEGFTSLIKDQYIQITLK